MMGGVGNRIEPAPTSRSKCITCGERIEKGAARLAEEYSDISIPKLIFRYYHVRCAAAVHPEMVRRALGDVRPGAVFDRAEIEEKLASRLAYADEQRRKTFEARQAERAAAAPVVAADETTRDLLAQLEADPEDPAVLAVAADQLQARGDVRGELIAIQLSLAAAGRVAIRRLPPREQDDDDDEDEDEDDDEDAEEAGGRVVDLAGRDLEALTRRRGELLAQLAAPIDSGDRAEWGTGFLRRLELHRKTAARLEEQRALWSHPSVCCLQELRLSLAATHEATCLPALAERLPRSVRRLELAGGDHLAGLPALLAALPRLEALTVEGRTDYERLAHPRLARLGFATAAYPGRVGEPARIAARLSPDALSALAALSLAGGSDHVLAPDPATSVPAWISRRDDFDEVCELLAMRWLGRLDELALLTGTLTEAGARALERGLAGRKLRRLDLTGTEVPLAAQPRLASLCEELVFPMPTVDAAQAVWVEHASKPEWGRGAIVRRFDGKLEVKFPGHGVKVFKADAPFLRLGS